MVVPDANPAIRNTTDGKLPAMRPHKILKRLPNQRHLTRAVDGYYGTVEP